MFPSIPLFGAFSQPFKRAQFGLFGGKTKQYGNNVPFSKHKTRRTWLPNVQRKRIPSEALGQSLRLKVTTRALRTIKKHGGLDNYVKKTRADKLSYEGLRIRTAVKEQEKKKSAAEAAESLQAAPKPEQVELVTTSWQTHYQDLTTQLHKKETLLEQPTMAYARKARMEAAKALGLEGLASAQQAFKYLEETR